MKPLHIRTPLHQSRDLRPGAGHAFLKLEALQPSGSFKLRGVGKICRDAAEAGAKSIIVPSGGNAGIAAAYSGLALDLPVTVVVPKSTSNEAKQILLSYGAHVKVIGNSFDEACAYASDTASKSDAIFVHPFDDPALWAGHSSLIDEVMDESIEFDCVLTAVGGGGLLLGILEGLANHNLQHIPVFGVETYGADCLSQAIEKNEIVTLDAITSIATSLGSKKIAAPAFSAAKASLVQNLRVTDRQAVDAVSSFLDSHRILVEPACGAVLAAAKVHHKRLEPYQSILVIVCGGAGVSMRLLSKWKRALSAE